MVKEIRLVKGRELGNREYSMGVSHPHWEPSWFRLEFPGSGPWGGKNQSIKNYITIKDGDANGVPVFYRSARSGEKDIPEEIRKKAGQAVPAEEILSAILSEPGNVRSFGQNAKGYTKKSHFGVNRKWYVDYDADLEPVLSKYGIEFETNQTLGEQTFSNVMGQLTASGVDVSKNTLAPGQLKAAEALAQKQAAELEELKAKLAEVEAKADEDTTKKKKATKKKVEPDTKEAATV